jgi:predicted RND superfamily exporter protein
VKLINYFLIVFICLFILLSIFLQPIRFGVSEETKFSDDLPEVKLNIPLDDQVSIEEYSEIDINILQDDIKTSFLPAWTVKVSSYNDLTELKRDLAELKKMGYKVYSQYESNDKINFSLFIGPTLNREDSIIIFDEISNMKKFNPEILKYD